MIALEAERHINEAIERMVAKGFKLSPNKFGDEACGCPIGAFMQDRGGRKSGESARAYASRIFEVPDDYVWAFVDGFDGKGFIPRLGSNREEALTWNEAGRRVATRWLPPAPTR